MPDLTTTAAAARLGVTPRRVRQYLREGRLPGAYRLGRDWAIPEQTLAEFAPRPVGWPGHSDQLATPNGPAAL